MKMMQQNRDPQLAEDGFSHLLKHAGAHVDALIDAFSTETDHGIRCWLLELLGAAKDLKAYDILAQQALSSDERLRYWAIEGLRDLDTKASRTLLFEIGASARPEKAQYDKP